MTPADSVDSVLSADKLRESFKKATAEVLGIPKLEAELNTLRASHANLGRSIEEIQEKVDSVKKAIGV